MLIDKHRVQNHNRAVALAEIDKKLESNFFTHFLHFRLVALAEAAPNRVHFNCSGMVNRAVNGAAEIDDRKPILMVIKRRTNNLLCCGMIYTHCIRESVHTSCTSLRSLGQTTGIQERRSGSMTRKSNH